MRYVQLGYEEMAAALVEAGLSRSFASLHVEMTRAFNQARVRPRAGRTVDNTTPTRFEQFVDELALAYEVGAASRRHQTLSIRACPVRLTGRT